MAKSLKTSAKKPATKVAAPKSTKSVRRSTKIGHTLAAFSNGLADAAARGVKPGSTAAQLAGQRAAAGVVLPKILDPKEEKLARTRAQKKFVGKMGAVKAPAKKKSLAKKVGKIIVTEVPAEVVMEGDATVTFYAYGERWSDTVNELKMRVLGGERELKDKYDSLRRAFAQMCELQGGTQRVGDKIVLRMGTPELPVVEKERRMDAKARNEAHAKRRSAIRSGTAKRKTRKTYWGWQPGVAISFADLSLSDREHELLKRAYLLPDQLKRETRDQRSKWSVSPKAFLSLGGQYAEGVRAVKGWSVWLWESGWLKGTSDSDSGTTTGAKIKKSRPSGRAESRESSQKVAGRVRSSFNTVRDQKMWKPEETPFSEMDKVPCVVPNCEQYSRRPFEARGVRGMEPADGKAVCRTHGELLISVSRSSLDWTKKELMVGDLLGNGQEPDPDLLASAKPAEKRQPVRAHAVTSASAKVLAVNQIAAGMIAGDGAMIVQGLRETVVSGNGNGDGNASVTNAPAPEVDGIPCILCQLEAVAKEGDVCAKCAAIPEDKEILPVRCSDCGGVAMIHYKHFVVWQRAAGKPVFCKACKGKHILPREKPVHTAEKAPAQAAPAAKKNLCPLCQLREAPAEGKLCEVCHSTPEDGRKLAVKCTDCGGVAKHYKHFVQLHRGQGKSIWCDACRDARRGVKSAPAKPTTVKDDGFAKVLDGVEAMQDHAPAVELEQPVMA